MFSILYARFKTPASSWALPIIAKSLKDLSCNFPVCGVFTKPAFAFSFNRFISALINSRFVPSYKRNYRKTRSVIMENNLGNNSFLPPFLYSRLDKSVLKCLVCLHLITSATYFLLFVPWTLFISTFQLSQSFNIKIFLVKFSPRSSFAKERWKLHNLFGSQIRK